MKVNFQKLVSVILSVCMLLSMCSFTVFADETSVSHVEYYVKATATAGGDGSLASPFNSLQAAVSAVKAAITAETGTATLYILPTGDEKDRHNPFDDVADGTYLSLQTINNATCAHPNITITYKSYDGEYEGKVNNAFTGDNRGSIANFTDVTFYGYPFLISGPTVFEDVVLLDMRQQNSNAIHANNFDVKFGANVDIYTADGRKDTEGNITLTNQYNTNHTADQQASNESYFQKKGRRLYAGVHSSYKNVYSETAPRIDYSALVPSAELATKSGIDFVMGGYLHTAIPGATLELPAGTVTIVHLTASGALDADEVFTGPMNVVLNGTRVSLFRVVEDVTDASQPTVTSATIPDGIQIIKNNGAVMPVPANIQCNVYNITVADTTAALDVTDTVGTYTVTGGAGVAYTTVGNNIYYSVNGKLTVPAAGEYTVNTAATLDAVKAAVNADATWIDNGAGVLTKAASSVYFVKPGATGGDGTEAKPFGALTEVVAQIKADNAAGLIGDKATVKIMTHADQKASGLWNNKYDRQYYLDYRTLNNTKYAHPEVTITYTSYESNEGTTDPEYINDKRGRIAFGFSGSKYIHMLLVGPTKFENIILLDFRNDGTYSNIHMGGYDVTFGKYVDVYQTSNVTVEANKDTTRTDVELVNTTAEVPTYFAKNPDGTKLYLGGNYEMYNASTLSSKTSKVVFEEIPTDGIATAVANLFVGDGQHATAATKYVNLLGKTVYLPVGYVHFVQLFESAAATLTDTKVSGPYNIVLNGTTVNTLYTPEGTATAAMLPDGLQIIKNSGAKINVNSVDDMITAPYYDITVDNVSGFTLDVTDTVGTYTVTGGSGVAYAVPATGKNVYYQVGNTITVPAGVYTVSSAATVDAIKTAVNSEVSWIDNGAGILTRGHTVKEFYVSNSVANSTQDGTAANPFKNVKAAVDYANSNLNLIEGDIVKLIINDNYKAIGGNRESTTGYTAWAQSGGQMTSHVYTLLIEGAYGQGDNGTFLATENNLSPCYNSIYMGGPTIFKNINLIMMRGGSDTTWGTSGHDVTFEDVTFYYTIGEGLQDKPEKWTETTWTPATKGSLGNIAICASSASAPMGSGGHVVMRNVTNVNKIMTGSAAPTYTGDLTIELDNVKNDNGASIAIVFGGYRGGQTNGAGQYYNVSGDANSGINESIDPYNLSYVTNIKGDLTLIANDAKVYARTWDPQWSFKYCGPVNIDGDLNIIGMNGSDISGLVEPDKNVPNGADATKLNGFVVAGNKYYLSIDGEADVTISDNGVATTVDGYFYTASRDGNTVKYTKTYTLSAPDTICYANAAPSFAALTATDSALAAATTAPLGQVFNGWTVDEANSTLTAKFITKSYPVYYVKWGVTAGSSLTYNGVAGTAYPTVVDAIAAINATGLYTAADAVPVIVLEDDTDFTNTEGKEKGYWFYDSNGNYIKGTKAEQQGGFWTDSNGVAGGVYGRFTSYSLKDSTVGQKHEWTLLIKAPDGATRKPYLAYTNRYGENSIITLSGPTVFQNIAIVANRNTDREIAVNGYEATFDGCTFNYIQTQQFSNATYNNGIAEGHVSVMLQKAAAEARADAEGGTVKFVGTKFSTPAANAGQYAIYPVRNVYNADNGAGDFENTVSFVFENCVDAANFSWSTYNAGKSVTFKKGLEVIVDGNGSAINAYFNSSNNDISVIGGALVVMKDGGVVNADANGDIIPAALNADKKWVITVDDYNVNLTGDGTLTTDAPYNYYVALVDGSYDIRIGEINNGIISDLPSGTYELMFVNTNPVDNDFADIRPVVTDDVNKQVAGSWTQKAGTNLYIARGFNSKYVVKQPLKRGSSNAGWFENDNGVYTLNLADTFMGNGVVSFKAIADGTSVVQPNIAYGYSASDPAVVDQNGDNIPLGSVRYVTMKYYYKTVEGGGALVGTKALGFNVGRVADPLTGYDSTWYGGNNNASLDTYVANQWATLTFDIYAQTRWVSGVGNAPIFEDLLAENPDLLISCLRVRPFGQTAGDPALAAGEEFYIGDFIFTDYDPRTSLDTYYVSENGTASGDGASLATALNSLEAVYELADASGFSEVDIYIDGTVPAGTLAKNEYTGITFNILPLNASGDKITELNAVANTNLGAVAVEKLNLISGIVTNNSATVGTVAVGNVNEAQFNQLGGSLGAVTQTAGTTANKVVFFATADNTLPEVNVTADELIVVRGPIMQNDKKTVRFPVAPTDKIGVFETYSGSEYQFGWGLVPYTCYVQNGNTIFYSNVNTGYKLTIDEPGDYQLMIVGTETNQPTSHGRATYYFTTKTLTRTTSDKFWTESVTVPGDKNDFYGRKIVLFPLSPDATAWGEDAGTGKITAITQPNYSFDGVTYTAKKAHTVDFANFVEPIVPEGMYFTGWQKSGAYLTGSQNLAAGDVLTAQFASYDLGLDKDISVLGAQIRIKGEAEDLRFVSKISKAFLNTLGITEYAGENVKFGTVLIPTTYQAFDEFGIGYTDTKGNASYKCAAVKTFDSDETSVTFTAVLTGLADNNNFRDFAARPYIEYVDGNGVTRVVYGAPYDTSIYEIADYALKLDAAGTRPVDESTKTTLTGIRDAIEEYVFTPYNGNTVRRYQSDQLGATPGFETENTGRHTDVHLASGAYADVTADQFAQGKVFYYTNYGTVVREVHITGGTEETEIGVLSDTHIEIVDFDGCDMYDPEYLLTAQTRSSWNTARVDDSFINGVKMASLSDKFIITGDIIDYTAYASLDFLKEHAAGKYDNGIYILGNHDATMTVGTSGRNDAFTARDYDKAVQEYLINDPNDIDGDGNTSEIIYHSEVVNGVMLINIDNGSVYEYCEEQLERFKQDLQIAKENGYIILMFQHIPISSGDPLDEKDYPIEAFGDKAIASTGGVHSYAYRNFYNMNTSYSTEGSMYNFSYNMSRPNDAVNDEMYTLITNNSDIIRGIFNGHLHQSDYSEIVPRDADGNVYDSETVDGKIVYYYMNGEEKIYVPTIPQYNMASSNYTNYATTANVTQQERGTMVKIVVTPAK